MPTLTTADTESTPAAACSALSCSTIDGGRLRLTLRSFSPDDFGGRPILRMLLYVFSMLYYIAMVAIRPALKGLESLL